jgi:hypothetical protein
MFSGLVGTNSWYGNYDGFGIYCQYKGDPAIPGSADPNSCGVLTQHAKRMSSGNK